MYVNVIDSGHVSSFDYLLFPDQNPINQIYIQNQLAQFNASLTDIGKKFLEASQNIYNTINDSNTIRMAKAALKMAKGLFHPNVIVPLETIEDLRAAQVIMQRYIMAEPMLRSYYHKQRCDGYSDTYIDVEPGRVGDDHYDYRRVMDGVVVDITDTDGNYEWSCKNYYEDLHTGDRELTSDEKVDVMNTWDVMKIFVDAGKDPTCIFGGDIGA